MRQKWKTALKCAAGALAALALLNLFCAWYYNPTAYEWDAARATDTIRTPGAWTSRATEGCAWMRMDANGYNNAAVPGEDGVSVLMMGSSHAEALNVMQDQSAAAQLGAMLAADGEAGMVYNIGISSHTLPRCTANLRRALERFQPTECVVMETQDVVFSAASLASAHADAFERLPATDVPLPDWITDQPLARALYQQAMSLMGAEEEAQDVPFELTDENFDDYVATLAFWLEDVGDVCAEYGVTAIIYYHPHLALQADGSAVIDAPPRFSEALGEAAARVGIVYLDLSEAFLDAYAESGALPHGFANTAAGAGHLNAVGHEIVAEALYACLRGESGATT